MFRTTPRKKRTLFAPPRCAKDNELKNNLISKNDFVKFVSNDENIYIILCDIKFDREKLNNANLNKIINLNVYDIENKFIQKYSKIFNLVNVNE